MIYHMYIWYIICIHDILYTDDISYTYHIIYIYMSLDGNFDKTYWTYMHKTNDEQMTINIYIYIILILIYIYILILIYIYINIYILIYIYIYINMYIYIYIIWILNCSWLPLHTVADYQRVSQSLSLASIKGIVFKVWWVWGLAPYCGAKVNIVSGWFFKALVSQGSIHLHCRSPRDFNIKTQHQTCSRGRRLDYSTATNFSHHFQTSKR